MGSLPLKISKVFTMISEVIPMGYFAYIKLSRAVIVMLLMKELLARVLFLKALYLWVFITPKISTSGPFQTYQAGHKTLLRYSRQLMIKCSCSI